MLWWLFCMRIYWWPSSLKFSIFSGSLLSVWGVLPEVYWMWCADCRISELLTWTNLVDIKPQWPGWDWPDSIPGSQRHHLSTWTWATLPRQNVFSLMSWSICTWLNQPSWGCLSTDCDFLLSVFLLALCYFGFAKEYCQWHSTQTNVNIYDNVCRLRHCGFTLRLIYLQNPYLVTHYSARYFFIF